MDDIKRQFEVTIIHHGAPTPVTLPVLRNEAEVERLKSSAAFEAVIARAVETPGVDTPVKPAETVPAGFRTALRALVECYRKAEAEGHTELAARAEKAVAALLGHQPLLKADDEGESFGSSGPRPRTTLVGIPGGQR